ncbi:xylose isomerase-like protein [Triangularia verruculosa]|uniref:Apurinic-apyrimidinic endonuclease 1 n=1 Tax=Triangularia verruculosa TaxID=2587418 RepID=A0AAN7B036_9PEZI|nr:xylose isomerase-like protein [Triangularia verruculosa]
MARQSTRKAAQPKPATETAVKIEKKVVATKVAKSGGAVVEAKVEVNKRAVTKRKVDYNEEEDEDGENADSDVKDEDEDEPTQSKPAPKKRKTAATSKKADDNMPLASRTPINTLKLAMKIGAHVSAAGGVQNSITNASNIGANAFALFLKPHRTWNFQPFSPDSATQFTSLLKTHSYTEPQTTILPHASYLINLAQPDKTKATQAYTSFLDDLKRCDALGISLYNFHPGSTGGLPMSEACARIAAHLNTAHKATKSVITVLENMCGSGNIIGSNFSDLATIISLVDDKSRVGVCLDTCHAFAAGYDLRTPETYAKTMKEFDDVVGLKYLKAFHLNDSKAPFSSHRDLHENIGQGFLGLRAFHNVVNDERLQNIPMVLETPIEVKGLDGKKTEDKKIWADEIKLLESLIGMDPGSKEFKNLEVELQKKGAAERKRVQEQVDKKAEKDAKKAAPKGKKGAAASRKKKKAEEEEACDSCGEDSE